MANYQTYERPIDLYSDCQNYFIGCIENNPDKDYIVWRSGYSTNTIAIGRFKYENGTFTGVAEQIISYSGYRTNQEQYNIIKGGEDNDFALSQTDKFFAFSNVSRETPALHGIEQTPQIYSQLSLISGLFFVGVLFVQLVLHRKSWRGKSKYN